MKIAVVGAAGRMGQMLVRRIAHTEGVSLAAASESPSRNKRVTASSRHFRMVTPRYCSSDCQAEGEVNSST